MSLVTVTGNGDDNGRGNQRWSANKKTDAVMRLLRGEPLDQVSRDIGIEAHRLAAWRDDSWPAASRP
jgi:transposase-like protein